METPERLDNLPATPEPSIEVVGEGHSIEEARLNQLKVEKGVCVICYCNLKTGKRCFPENCLHIFHFECLKRWSEQKNQCPLCKKVFDSIVHNVKSKTEFDRQPVQVIHRPDDSTSPVTLRNIVSIPMLNSVFHQMDFVPMSPSFEQRYMYRTRFEATFQQNEAIQELFGAHDENDFLRQRPAAWRNFIYERNLHALPLPDSAGRYRECSSEFYRNNPSQTHRLIPWLNRELVVLLPNNQTSAIPQILEDMREMLCRYDIRSRTIRKYFRRFLYLRTDHFIHEFYNFAISAFDIMSYDRNVDYRARNPSTSTTTVEISDGSSEGEVLVIEPLITFSPGNDVISTSPVVPSVTTTVVLETSGAQEENCIITDVAAPPQASHQVTFETGNDHESNRSRRPVLLESSSDSECQFVLALKPPHLRTPEMLSLDSASDSDVVFIPNPPDTVTRVDSTSTDSEDNKPLAITKMKLKAELEETKSDIKEQILELKNILEPEVHIEDSSLNFGASTSQQEPLQAKEITPRVKKFYFAPKRKRISTKNVLEPSSSSGSSSSDNSSSSSSESSNAENGYHKLKKRRRRMAEKNMKRIRLSTAKNQKPLSLLPSTEEARESDDKNHPPIRSVIIVKNNSNHHYIKQNLTTSTESSSSQS